MHNTPYMDATLNQQIPANTTIMDSGNVSIGSVGSIPSTETPPPGYMSEDGDPMDQNDNLSELVSDNDYVYTSLMPFCRTCSICCHL